VSAKASRDLQGASVGQLPQQACTQEVGMRHRQQVVRIVDDIERGPRDLLGKK
jgi:hypothetical protein